MSSTGSLTKEELQQAATSGKGGPPSAIDEYRSKHRPEYLHGLKTESGAIASGPYQPPIDLDPRCVDSLLPLVTKHDTDANGRPRNVRQEAEHGDVLTLMRNAFDGSYKGLDAIGKARAAAASNDAWTPAEQLRRVGDMAGKTLERLTAAFDRAHKHLTDFSTALDKGLSAPLEGQTQTPLAQEIRAHIKAMPLEKRSQFVGEALQRGDRKVLEAALGAPAFLSGMSEAQHMNFTRLYREASNPVAVARLAVAKKGLELLEARAGLVFTEIEKAMGGSFAKLNKIREANSAAEAALIMRDGLL